MSNRARGAVALVGMCVVAAGAELLWGPGIALMIVGVMVLGVAWRTS